MRKIHAICSSVLLCMSAISAAVAQTPASSGKAILYTIKNHETERRINCVNFDVGAIFTRSSHCDLGYGNLSVGQELDWFQSASGAGDRSVIRDLGAYEWAAKFSVPVVEPLPKLQPGERRAVTIDASGARGADGLPGRQAPEAASPNNRTHSLHTEVYDSMDPRRYSAEEVVPPLPRPNAQPRGNGEPQVDSMFVKVIPGHIYVARVVDDKRDFYALFRVEALERGDNCTVTWKLIPAPVAKK